MNFNAGQDAPIEARIEAKIDASATPLPPAAGPQPAPPKPKVKLRPLASLFPYVKRYRWRAISALGALTLAALTTLVVPLAVRRMIDFGFTGRGIALIDSFFLVMIGVAALLAFASSM